MAVRHTAVRTGLLPPTPRTAALVAGGVLGVIAVRSILVAAHHVLGWAAAATLLALCISPIVRGLDRALPRPLAAIVGAILLVVAIVAVALLYSTGVRSEVDRLAEEGPALAEEIEQRDDRIGTFASDIDLARQVGDLTDRLSESVGSGGDSLRNAAISAPTYLVTMILTIFFVLFGQRLVRGGLQQLPERHRDRLGPALPEAARRAQLYVGASLLQGLVNGLVVYVIAGLVDAPGAGLLALFAATLAMVPYLGIALGWLPLIVFGFGLVSLPEVALLGVLAVGLQIAESCLWRRLVDPRSLHLGPAIPVVSAVIGYAVYGIGGALVASGTVVFAVALADQLGDRTSVPTPLGDEV